MRVGDRDVDRLGVRLVEMLEQLDLAVFRTEQHRLVPGILHGSPRFHQFGLFDALARYQKSDLLRISHTANLPKRFSEVQGLGGVGVVTEPAYRGIAAGPVEGDGGNLRPAGLQIIQSAPASWALISSAVRISRARPRPRSSSRTNILSISAGRVAPRQPRR